MLITGPSIFENAVIGTSWYEQCHSIQEMCDILTLSTLVLLTSWTTYQEKCQLGLQWVWQGPVHMGMKQPGKSTLMLWTA